MLYVMSFTYFSTLEKLVGPESFTYVIAFLYASITPSRPSHSGLKMSPFSAKQWLVLFVEGIKAPKPNTGIFLSAS